MRFFIIVAGKPALAFSKLATAEYLKRLSRYGDYQLKFVKDGDSQITSKNLLEASQGTYRIALDERGLRPTTRELEKRINSLEMNGNVKTVSFLIGASDGHTEELREKSDMILSLSSLTMQHELALVVLLEQIYRLATIKVGSPYHRD